MRRLLLAVAMLLGIGLLSATAAVAYQTGEESPSPVEVAPSLPEVAPPEFDAAVSEAELQDLQTLARQSGLSLQAAIDRYAWNDTFALDERPTADPEIRVTTEGEWTLWLWAAPLIDRTTRAILGKPYNDGCTYEFEATADQFPPTGFVFMDRAAAENLRMCILMVESGFVAIADITFLDPGLANDPGEVATAVASSKSAWVKHGYEDPPGFDVNWTRSEVSWSYNGSCVTDSWAHDGDTYHLWVTGWTRDWFWWDSAQNCSWGRTRTFAQFHNSGFCIGQPTTYIKYDSTQIYGYSKGTYGYQLRSSKWGGCTNLLSPFVLYGSS